MEEILRFLQNYEIWIYTILGIGVLFPANQVIRALREWRGAAFGLERESARRRFSNGMTVVLVFFVLGAVEFFLVSFLLPNRPRSTILATPTIDLLATSTVTLAAGALQTVTPTGFSLSVTPVANEGCTPGKIEWTFPKNGGQLKGTVVLKGTIQSPNLGFYKYEYSPTGSDKWTTIAAGNKNTTNEELGGAWNTAQLTPGDYQLRLVVADNQNQVQPACVITIRIIAP
jgi:hypothetical protein